MADIRDAAVGSPLQVPTANIIKKVHIYVSNVTGTDAYWTSSRFKMKAAIFYRSYIEEDEISLFHTGSLAEYHEPHLRSILSKYTRHIDGLPEGYSESIMEYYDFLSTLFRHTNML